MTRELEEFFCETPLKDIRGQTQRSGFACEECYNFFAKSKKCFGTIKITEIRGRRIDEATNEADELLDKIDSSRNLLQKKHNMVEFLIFSEKL